MVGLQVPVRAGRHSTSVGVIVGSQCRRRCARPRRDNRQQIDDGGGSGRRNLVRYFQLRQLPLISRSICPDAAKAVVQAFIVCRLDYCNSLLFGTLQRIQADQNAAAHHEPATRTNHVTPVLRQLYWLPVKKRVEYKLAILTYHAVHGLLPSYLAGDCDCQLVSTTRRRQLKSSDIATLAVQRRPLVSSVIFNEEMVGG